MFTVAPHSLQSKPSSSGPCLSHDLPQMSIQPFELQPPFHSICYYHAFMHMTRTSAPIPVPHYFHLLNLCFSRSYLPKHLLKTSFSVPNSQQLQHPVNTAPTILITSYLIWNCLLDWFFLNITMTAWDQGLWLLSLNLSHGLVNIH